MAEHEHDAPLQWPPRPIQPQPAVPREPAQPPAHDRPPPSPSSWLEQIERVWLGLIDPPTPRALELAGWAPLPESASCPRCGEPSGPFEAGPDGCPACRDRRLPWTRCVRLGVYDPVARGVIHHLKFHRQREAGNCLGGLLADRLARAIDRDGLDRARVVIVPVPMSWRRRMARGIDHTLVLARAIGRQLGCPVERALGRVHRPPQWSIPPSRRQANVAGSFRPARRRPRPCDVAVLVDDVRTTGATLRGASRALAARYRRASRAGASPAGRPDIWTAVVAVASDRRPQLPQAAPP